MEWLASILNNPNSWKSFIFFFITLITLIILVKKGIISFKGKGLTVGNNETERTIIRNQIMFVNTEISDFYNKIPFFDGRDEWRLKFIMEKFLKLNFNHTIGSNITLMIMNWKNKRNLLKSLKESDLNS